MRKEESSEFHGGALRDSWSRLHQTDREPWPDARAVDRLLKANAPLRLVDRGVRRRCSAGGGVAGCVADVSYRSLRPCGAGR